MRERAMTLGMCIRKFHFRKNRAYRQGAEKFNMSRVIGLDRVRVPWLTGGGDVHGILRRPSV